MNMDYEKLIKMLMMNADRRRVVSEMAASVISAAVVYEKSENDILAIMNILIKAEIEKNHTLFRDIVKTGTSFDDFTQETVNLIFSHVNAVKRKQFNGKSAYDMFSFYYSEILASALGISFVPANEVIQSPKLLAKSFS